MMFRYVQHLTESGFSDIQVHDLTEDWRQFVHERLVDYKINREKHVAVHGEKIVNGVTYFFTEIDNLFAGGNLGGIFITGKKN
jgi:hypothetical protein